MHEHVFVLDADVQQNYPSEWGSEDELGADVVKLKALAAQGIRTIVDPTVIGLGRVHRRHRRRAGTRPAHHPRHGLLHLHQVLFSTTATAVYAAPVRTLIRMIEMFTADITEGITGTGVKASMCDRPYGPH